ncbi:MAG: hypothetical protein ACRC8S_07615 [Fimbriiglobus sp.]
MMLEDHVATDKMRMKISGFPTPLTPEEAAELNALIRISAPKRKRRSKNQPFRKTEFPAEVEETVLGGIHEIIAATEERLANLPPEPAPPDEAERLKREAEKQAAIEAQAEKVRAAARRVHALGRLRSKPKSEEAE